jgi:hypothetical protein
VAGFSPPQPYSRTRRPKPAPRPIRKPKQPKRQPQTAPLNAALMRLITQPEPRRYAPLATAPENPPTRHKAEGHRRLIMPHDPLKYADQHTENEGPARQIVKWWLLEPYDWPEPD